MAFTTIEPKGPPKAKKKLEIDPLHADRVRLAFRLALEGDGVSGCMGVKSIANCRVAAVTRGRAAGRPCAGQLPVRACTPSRRWRPMRRGSGHDAACDRRRASFFSARDVAFGADESP
jgi:hypothetical protein